ncbi:MAG: DivIVA domain-containing protein [Jatrophihabitantaceae bacterium]
MTPDEVRSVRFGKASIGKRGYDEESVDGLLDRIEASLAGHSSVTRAELSRVTFRRPPIGKRGYRKDDVDAFMQRVLAEW